MRWRSRPSRGRLYGWQCPSCSGSLWVDGCIELTSAHPTKTLSPERPSRSNAELVRGTDCATASARPRGASPLGVVSQVDVLGYPQTQVSLHGMAGVVEAQQPVRCLKLGKTSRGWASSQFKLRLTFDLMGCVGENHRPSNMVHSAIWKRQAKLTPPDASSPLKFSVDIPLHVATTVIQFSAGVASK